MHVVVGSGFSWTTEDFSITSFRIQGLLFYQPDVTDMVQQYRMGFSVLRHTAGQIGQLSSLQVVILCFTGALSKKSAPSFFSVTDYVLG